MKHSSTRDLYSYWNQRRGARAAPDRSEIDPTAIPRVLADTFLLCSDDHGEMSFRLAGTRVCALFCREIRGESFAALFERGDDEQIVELLATVCDEPIPVVAGTTARLTNGTAADLELLLLPLRHRGRTDARILGALAPVAAPDWLGAVPVVSLSLGSSRWLRSIGAPAALSHALLHSGRARHGFMVYNGGRR